MRRFGERRRTAGEPTDPERPVGVAGAVRRGLAAVGQAVGERLATSDPELLHPGERFPGMEVSYEEYREITTRLADIRLRASVVAADSVLARNVDLSVPETLVPEVERAEVRTAATEALDLLAALREDGRRNRERLAALDGDPSSLPSVDEETYVRTVERLETLAEREREEVDHGRVADTFGDVLALLYDCADVRRTEARRQQNRGAEIVDAEGLDDGIGPDGETEGEAQAQDQSQEQSQDQSRDQPEDRSTGEPAVEGEDGADRTADEPGAETPDAIRDAVADQLESEEDESPERDGDDRDRSR